MVLVDTSVVFRRPARLSLEDLVDFDEVVTCLPIVQEVVQGFRDETAYNRARRAMLALPVVDSPLRDDVLLHAADLFRAGRRAGLTIRSGVDCRIAASAIRHQLEVLHCDRDYEAIAKVSSLRSRRVTIR